MNQSAANNLAMMRRVRFANTEEEKKNAVKTQFIVKETDEEESEVPEEATEKDLKKKKAEDDLLYFYGYFSWYWGKHGFFKAFKSFFGMRISNGIVFSFFNSIGAAIGAFFFKRWFL
jgi:hypothetical protein